MINIKRSYPAPKSLEVEKNKLSGTYNKKDVVDKLREDFYDKCYICESRSSSSQVEHLKSHKGDLSLKFDWENLFLSCGHCNNTKLDKYDDILDCTKEDVESKIKYKMDCFPMSDVCLYCVDKDKNTINRTEKTIELLEKCYNGSTPLKNIDSDNIKKDILDELLDFNRFINDYLDYFNLDEYDKLEYLERKIKLHLSKKSKYTSFKRWIIKDNKKLYELFGKYLLED